MTMGRIFYYMYFVIIFTDPFLPFFLPFGKVRSE